MKNHYVYKVTNTKPLDKRKYYIGVRTAKNCSPEEDTKYLGSSKTLLKHIKEIGKEHFTKEVLSKFETREEAIEEEIRIHEELNIAVNSQYYNRCKQTPTGFDRTGAKDTPQEREVINEYYKKKQG